MGIVTLEGENWANRRKLITPAFHFEKLKAMVPAFSASCCSLIDRWEKLIEAKGSCEIDVSPEFNILAWVPEAAILWQWLPEVYKGVEGCWKTEKEGGGTTLDLLQWLPELQRSSEKVVGEKEKQNSKGKE
ncbi:hypothetical protein RJT34_20512 [Clitoria ternatea]|uniref:Uncharacterized protein n=1 Tax=Clitoria ternatea TaxID=43366 RepID=A0AAN9ISY5_CLITE